MTLVVSNRSCVILMGLDECYDSVDAESDCCGSDELEYEFYDYGDTE